jgi:hypothetical protein
MTFLAKKLFNKQIWKRIFYERLTEPLHLNILSIFVFLLGGIKQKINFDLVLRQQHAYGLLAACEQALRRGLSSITVIEFGVASGTGLMNMVEIANKLTKKLGIKINIIGFDTGKGMPVPIDYRDHVNLYGKGDFPMMADLLREKLPENAKLVLGEVKDTVLNELELITEDSPIGFVSFDLDYYSSTKDALSIFNDKNPNKYLPHVIVYLDDISLPEHNEYAGAMLAVKEFNETDGYRKLCIPNFLASARIFKNATWIKQIRYAHIMDHPHRYNYVETGKSQVISNPYLVAQENKTVIFRN